MGGLNIHKPVLHVVAESQILVKLLKIDDLGGHFGGIEVQKLKFTNF